MSSPKAPQRSEDGIGSEIDKCLADGIIKLGGGILVGGVTSLLFFKRRSWPVIIGAGIGLGMAYSNCESRINNDIKNNLRY